MKSIRNAVVITLVLLLTGCQTALTPTAAPINTVDDQPENETREPGTVTVTFIAEIPEDLPREQELMVEFLDEITGLAIVPVRVPMEKVEGVRYQLTRDLPDRTIIKYRYYRRGENPSVEYNAIEQQVRYRTLFTPYARQVRDLIAGWNDTQKPGDTGTIEGRITSSLNGEPVGGILISCGGDQVLSSADGTYRLEKLMPGLHNLTVMSLNGAYYPVQQEAVVASNSSTPAEIKVSPAQMAQVLFVLNTGGVDTGDYPIRIIGDLAQAGNTFSNQGAEQSVLADLAPMLEKGDDGNYQTFLQLPKGLVYTYKYSLGDGLWNSERDENGGLVSRKQLISEDVQVIQDDLQPFGKADGYSIDFFLKVPQNTPFGDHISIQFNPFDWSPPLPMTRRGDDEYQYTLFGPQDLLGEISYRYCRNLVCDNIWFSTNGEPLMAQGVFHAIPGDQQFLDEITAWTDWQPSSDPTIVHATEGVTRRAGFIGGLETQPDFSPAAMTIFSKGLDAALGVGADTLFLTPTWEILFTEPLVVRQTSGRDPSLEELARFSAAARQRNLQIGFFPQILSGNHGRSYQAADLANINPNQMAEAVNRFYMHFALAARQNAAQYLVVDGDYLDWRYETGVIELLINIRSQFKNKILVSATPSELEWYPEGLLEQFDGIYLLLQCPLLSDFDQEEGEEPASISDLLDGRVKKLTEEKRLPIIIGIHFPAIEDSSRNCVQTSREWLHIRQGFSLSDSQPVNLKAQSDLYNEVFSAVATRSWITGVITRGFVLESARKDNSASIHGKPASDILWYWFSQLRN
jgi:hypothetical protein